MFNLREARLLNFLDHTVVWNVFIVVSFLNLNKWVFVETIRNFLIIIGSEVALIYPGFDPISAVFFSSHTSTLDTLENSQF